MLKKYFDFSNFTSKKYLYCAFALVSLILLFFIAILLIPGGTRIIIKENKSLSEEPKIIVVKKSSNSQTVKELLKENNIPISSNYAYSQNLDSSVRNLKELEISKKVDAEIIEDGNVINVESGATSIKELVDELGIVLKDNDEIEPSLDEKLTNETNHIIINHFDIQTVEREIEVGYNTIKQGDSNLPLGTQSIIQNGTNGISRVVEEVVYKGGLEVNRNILSEEVLTAATPEIVSVGTQGGSSLASLGAGLTTLSANNISNTTRTASGNIDLNSNNSYARLVDSGHPLPLSYEPSDLVSMGYGNSRMRQDAAHAFNLMKEQVAKDLNVELLPLSCYRSAQTQESISGNSGTAGAGYSEHQTGLAVDLGIPGYTAIDSSDHFETTQTYAWLRQNAQNYGFILSMPENTYWVEFEPWHWRFVGVDLAQDIWSAQQSGRCIQMADYFSN